MKRGRKPTPVPLRGIDGGRKPESIAFTPGLPDPPGHLGVEAKAEWRRVVSELSRVDGLLQKVDAATLAGYCIAAGTVANCEHTLRELGLTYTTTAKNGAEIERPRPEVVIRDRALKELRLFAQLFGFTPSSRAGLPAPAKGSKAGKLGKYLEGYGG